MTVTNGRLVAIGLGAASLVASLTAAMIVWPLVLIVGIAALVLLWSGADRGSAAAPVLLLIVVSLPFVFISEVPAIGPLAGCVLALAAGEVLALAQVGTDRGPIAIRAADPLGDVFATVAIATGAMVVVMVVAVVPSHRGLTMAAVVALAGLAAVVQRRRTTMPHASLPPPSPSLSPSSPSFPSSGERARGPIPPGRTA